MLTQMSIRNAITGYNELCINKIYEKAINRYLSMNNGGIQEVAKSLMIMTDSLIQYHFLHFSVFEEYLKQACLHGVP